MQLQCIGWVLDKKNRFVPCAKKFTPKHHLQVYHSPACYRRTSHWKFTYHVLGEVYVRGMSHQAARTSAVSGLDDSKRRWCDRSVWGTVHAAQRPPEVSLPSVCIPHPTLERSGLSPRAIAAEGVFVPEMQKRPRGRQEYFHPGLPEGQRLLL